AVRRRKAGGVRKGPGDAARGGGGRSHHVRRHAAAGRGHGDAEDRAVGPADLVTRACRSAEAPPHRVRGGSTMLEWLAAAAFLTLFLALLPRVGRRATAGPRRSGGSGVILAIGIAFSMIFDAKASQATELTEQKKNSGDSAAGESGDRPEGSIRLPP